MSNYIERYWRDATPADAILEPPMVARFRFEGDEDWEYDLLVGWDRTDQCHWRSELDAFDQCQVYDAPDPGEGWRLVDIDKDKPQFSDEYYLPGSKTWTPRDHIMPFNTEQSYRRRIEQPKPEPRYEPFRWEDREQLRGRWIGSNDGRWEEFITFIYKDSECFYANSISTESLLREWHFLDTGEPVGRKVEP